MSKNLTEGEQSVKDYSDSLKHFEAIDYVVFVFMLIVCSIIGLYFGYKDHVKHKLHKKKDRRGSDTLDYLLGGKNVQVFPVAMSLVFILSTIIFKFYMMKHLLGRNIRFWHNAAWDGNRDLHLWYTVRLYSCGTGNDGDLHALHNHPCVLRP